MGLDQRVRRNGDFQERQRAVGLLAPHAPAELDVVQREVGRVLRQDNGRLHYGSLSGAPTDGPKHRRQPLPSGLSTRADNDNVLVELVVKAVVVVAGAILLLTAYLYFTQRSQLYFPWPDPAAAAPLGVEPVELETDDHLSLGAWFIPAGAESGGGTRTPGPAVLVCNGNAGYRAHRLPLAQALSARGYHVLLFDYRGYAGNPGSPSEHGLAADARAAARALGERPE